MSLIGALTAVGTAVGVSGAIAAPVVGGAILGSAAVGLGTGIEALTNPAKTDTSTPNVPKLAPGLNPAMTPQQAMQNPVNTAPLQGLGAIGSPVASAAPTISPQANTAAPKTAAQGGIMHAKGGHVPLKDGAYIIPADVVSALGNGSSKAGAEFLQRLMAEVKNQAVDKQGLGAAKRHVA
jgi:hypothetical protein